MIEVVLVDPENPGNLGAVLRVMKNFGVDRLVVVTSKVGEFSEDELRSLFFNDEALARAMGGRDLVNKVLFEDYGFFDRSVPDIRIGTSARLGGPANFRRLVDPLPVVADRFSSLVATPDRLVQVVFGRESSGLTNDELSYCDFLVTIPASSDYPTLNLSHAVGVVLYEFFKSSNDLLAGRGSGSENGSLVGGSAFEGEGCLVVDRLTAADKRQLIRMSEELLDRMRFINDVKRDTQKVVWKHLFSKVDLSRKEAFVIMGFFGNLLKKAVISYPSLSDSDDPDYSDVGSGAYSDHSSP